MKNKKTSDFAPDRKPHTLVLREKMWRLELSRATARRFWKRRKVLVVGTLAVLAAGIVAHYVLVGFASTVDFYPSSCLGNWENVQNALGKPDLPPGALASRFTTYNSAVFGTSTAQMFCGNFSGDTDIAALTGKSFQEADIVLSWTFIFPQATAATTTMPSDSDAASSSLLSSTATSTDVSSSSDATIVVPTTTSSDASSSDTTPTDVAPVSTPDSTPTPTLTTTPASDSASTPDTSSASTNSTPVPPPPAPASPPAPADSGSDSTDAASSPTSWLRNFIGVAYADEDETSSLAEDTSTTNGDASISLQSDANMDMSAQTTTQAMTSSEPATTSSISVNTAAFQNITVSSSTGDAVLAIVYSTDGVTWQPIANIDSANWQTARYSIPIHSWVELEHLQVAFVGLGASSSPQIFLDSAGVEVSYADAPVQQDATSTPAFIPTPNNTAPDQSVVSVTTPIPPAPTAPPPAQAFKQVFDPFAGQQCSVTPFSESVVAGAGGSFLLKLTPPAESTSSVSSARSSSHATAPFLYDASVGSLPEGITATVVQNSPGMDTIGVTTVATVASGSYNAVVVYKERQQDGSIAPNFCQFNLVVQ